MIRVGNLMVLKTHFFLPCGLGCCWYFGRMGVFFTTNEPFVHYIRCLFSFRAMVQIVAITANTADTAKMI